MQEWGDGRGRATAKRPEPGGPKTCLTNPDECLVRRREGLFVLVGALSVYRRPLRHTPRQVPRPRAGDRGG